MTEPVYASDHWMNEKSNLDYTAYYGHHADETAAQLLAESEANLRRSQELLARSQAELRRAQVAAANLELQNLMTRFAHYTAAQMHRKAFDLFWSDRSDVAVSFPGFGYAGREAVLAYLDALAARAQAKLEELSPTHPDLTPDMAGAGMSDCLCLCTPYIVVAGDGQTAQGVWNLMRIAAEEQAQGKALSNYWFERWYVDFIYEKGSWKLWHMTVREDLCEDFDESQLPPGPMQLQLPRTGGNSPPGNVNMAGGMPMFPGSGALSAPREPSYPAPYETFDAMELTQGMTRARNDVGTVPEYMMHLPFAQAQQMGPPPKDPKDEKGGGPA